MTERDRSSAKGAGKTSSGSSGNPPAPEKAEPVLVVGIGASAGGLEALEGLFSGMPADTGMAFVVVQHLSPEHDSILAELIDRCAAMPACEVVDGTAVRPNHIYVIPPDRDLGILHGTLEVIEPAEPRGHRHPIDFFFRSLAQDQGDKAVCIVLSGTGSEGALGLRAVKEEGGLVIVQEPETAAYDGMPRSAAATGLADLVLAPREMAACLAEFAKSDVRKQMLQTLGERKDGGDDLQKVFLLIRNKTGHDLSFYKRNTIMRRIERRMMVHGIGELNDYIRYLRETPSEVMVLFKEMLIGVTNFFRDTEAFEALRDKALPALFKDRKADELIRVWVPGCSTGEEAYSIAMLLRDYTERNEIAVPVEVFATDIDGHAVEHARAGTFLPTVAADIPADFLKRYFFEDDGWLRVKKNIRDMLVFAEQNVVKDAPFSRIDLISCRNLLIYMGPQLQKKVLPLFHYALNPGGFLFLGTSESIGEAVDMFEAVDRKAKLFRRRLGQRAVPPAFDFTPSLPKEEPTIHAVAEGAPGDKVDYREVVERTVLADFSPTCLIVNNKSELLYVHGRTGKFFEVPTGAVTHNVVTMAREGLQADLAGGLRAVFRQGETFRRQGLRIKADGGDRQRADLTIRPILDPAALDGLAMVLIEDRGPDGDQERPEPDADEAARVDELEHELRSTREYLQTIIEELETANEELKSTNEELQSSNEELQSTNEEHETAKEELQSVNEELVTVNSELESKVEELGKVSNDMANLLASTDIGTIFLDTALNVARFTPAARQVVNLIASDVGRPLSHIASNLDYPDLMADAKEVLDTLNSRETEARSADGNWYLIRMRPYRTVDNVVDGIVMTFVDISDRKKLEAESRLSVVVRDSNDAVTVQDFSGTILAWNRGAETMYGIPEEQALGSSIAQVVPEAERQAFLDVIDKVRSGERLVNFETRRRGEDGTAFRIWLTASLLSDENGAPFAVATTERDISWLDGSEP